MAMVTKAVKQMAGQVCGNTSTGSMDRCINRLSAPAHYCWPCKAIWVEGGNGTMLFVDGVVEVARLRSEIVDLKERADIADTVHKEAMERLGRYEKALQRIVDFGRHYRQGQIASDALAKK